MIDERTMQLLNADIDGELEVSERVELDGILDRSTEARAMRAELLNLNNVLDGLPQQEPPAGLLQEILKNITLPGEKTGFSFSRLFTSFQPATAGLAFAAGLLVTVSFYELAPRQGASVDTAGMVGTMMANPASRPVDSRDILAFEGAGLDGSVALKGNNDLLMLDFDLDSDKQVEIEVAYAEAGLGFSGIAHTVDDPSEVVQSYRVTEGVLRVVNQGRQVFTVFLPEITSKEDGVREITIEISTDGARVFSGVLRG